MTGTAIHHQQADDTWRTRAACLDDNPELFYADSSAEQEVAVSICRACPVRWIYLAAAHAEENGASEAYRFGVRGGMTSTERARTWRNEMKRRSQTRRRAEQAMATAPKLPKRTRRVNNGQPLSKKLRDRIEWMIRDGWTNKAIVAETGINPSTASTYRKRLGIPSPYVSRTPECGTRSGYQRHVRLHERIDDACRQANADADNRLRRTGTTKALEKA